MDKDKSFDPSLPSISNQNSFSPSEESWIVISSPSRSNSPEEVPLSMPSFSDLVSPDTSDNVCVPPSMPSFSNMVRPATTDNVCVPPMSNLRNMVRPATSDNVCEVPVENNQEGASSSLKRPYRSLTTESNGPYTVSLIDSDSEEEYDSELRTSKLFKKFKALYSGMPPPRRGRPPLNRPRQPSTRGRPPTRRGRGAAKPERVEVRVQRIPTQTFQRPATITQTSGVNPTVWSPIRGRPPINRGRGFYRRPGLNLTPTRIPGPVDCWTDPHVSQIIQNQLGVTLPEGGPPIWTVPGSSSSSSNEKTAETDSQGMVARGPNEPKPAQPTQFGNSGVNAQNNMLGNPMMQNMFSNYGMMFPMQTNQSNTLPMIHNPFQDAFMMQNSMINNVLRQFPMQNPFLSNPMMQNPMIQNAMLQNPMMQNLAMMQNAMMQNAMMQTAMMQTAMMQNPIMQNYLSNPMMQNTSADNLTDNSTMQNTSADNSTIQNTSADNLTMQNTSVDNSMQNTSVDNSMQNTSVDNTFQDSTVNDLSRAYDLDKLVEETLAENPITPNMEGNPMTQTQSSSVEKNTVTQNCMDYDLPDSLLDSWLQDDSLNPSKLEKEKSELDALLDDYVTQNSTMQNTCTITQKSREESTIMPNTSVEPPMMSENLDDLTFWDDPLMQNPVENSAYPNSMGGEPVVFQTPTLEDAILQPDVIWSATFGTCSSDIFGSPSKGSP